MHDDGYLIEFAKSKSQRHSAANRTLEGSAVTRAEL